MTYNEKLRKVIASLNNDEVDSDQEWAIAMLKAIGITPDNPDGVEPPPVIAKPATEPPVIAPPIIYRNEEEKANISDQFRLLTPPPRKGW